jgi:hypothetical protein
VLLPLGAMVWGADWHGVFLFQAARFELHLRQNTMEYTIFVTAMKLEVGFKNPRRQLQAYKKCTQNVYLCINNTA